jgi:hypothetical protein
VVDPSALPQFEHGEVPQSRGVIGTSVDVLGQQALGLGDIEVAACPRRRIAQDFLDPRAQLAAKPLADRDPEALPATIDQMLGQPAPSRDLLEQPFRRAAPEFDVPGSEAA